MDQTKYQLYLMADGVYFDTPTRMTEARFGIAGRAAPPGWARREQEVWIVLKPNGIRLRDQGWKIHVSATMDDCEQTVGIVWDYCIAHGVPFKFLRSRRVLRATNSKHAHRGASGKLLTLYPSDDTMLAKTLTGLAPLLRSQQGPYILGDLRFEDGPLYVRYGAFHEVFCPDENGEPTLAMRGPDGRMMPDRRGPVFAVPEWVTVPDVLRPSLLARSQPSDETLPYTIEAPLHFTNGGGVYRASDPATGATVVLREARPHAGLDADGVDALTRLRSDRDLRARLVGLDCVPGLIGYHTVWEHEFLVEEFVEGRTLFDRMIERYPFAQSAPEPEEVAAYLDWFETMTARIGEALDRLHARGVHHGDVHPRNVIVREDGRVVLVDLELAGRATGPILPGLRAPGFAPPAQMAGMETDRYALECIRLYGRVPVTQLIDRDPSKVATLIDAAQELAGPVDPSRWRALTEQVPPGVTDEAAALFQAEPLDWPAIRDALVAGILTTATPHRTDRLFPGDVTQFVTGGISLHDGAAGVLYALHHAHVPIPASYVDWLVHAARDPQRGNRAGLFDGRHGVALLLDELGRTDDAREILALARQHDEWAPAAGLRAGRAGIALSLLRLGTRLANPSLVDDAIRYGDELVAMLAGDATEVRVPAAAGLMRGLSGVALALVRIYECTGDAHYLDAAEVALQRDVDRCVTLPDGSMHVDDGNSYVAYLDDGSGGIAVALHAYLRHRTDPALAVAIDGVRRSCQARFVFQPGLLRGRAGVVAMLNHLGRPADRPLILRHVRDLSLHAVARDGGLLFPGAFLLRLTADLATGSAGVLLALLAVFEADLPVLPFLEPETVRLPHAEPKEVNYEHPRPAGTQRGR